MLKLASRPQAGRAAGFSPLFEWAFRPRNPMKNRAPRDLVGRTPGPRRTPRPAAGPTVLASCRAPKADEGVPRGPGGPLPSRFFDSVGMGVPPAKFHEKPSAARFGGADPPVRAGRPRPAAGPTVSASCRAPAV